ncbi:MAG: SEC-C metal-binding domain-containing protein, partial [bacterium]
LYAADITYGTNSEFGFDYLRDNMVINSRERVQRKRFFGIVDEVDSILIDEARTPLIISGAGEQSTSLYVDINAIIPTLIEAVHYEKDEKEKHVTLTEDGVEKVEGILQTRKLLVSPHMFDPENSVILHHVNQALRYHVLFHRDVEYVVEPNGEVIIVDEFTGRKMVGRRYSDGLHQAIEAKEGVRVRNENQTLATITIQNYYRLYEKLAGMTGTAKTEEDEFTEIYGLTVVEIPTNQKMVRSDHPDLVYATQDGKYRAIAAEAAVAVEKGQPVLIGTVSVEVSEIISRYLTEKSIKHAVLNAKYHEKEAEIIAGAGQKGAVTVATNMAGRGTDIKLGDGVAGYGGLYIMGSERHESRRIDNQLRGRSGRQGDPGQSRFFISLEDDLMRIFGSDRVKSLMTRMGMTDEMPLEHGMLSKSIENAQKKVESHNFEIRKHVLKYDDIMEKQRRVIYTERDRILEGQIITDMLYDMVKNLVWHRLDRYVVEGTKPVEWDLAGLFESLESVFPLDEDISPEEFTHKTGIKREQIAQRLIDNAWKHYQAKELYILAAAKKKAEFEAGSAEVAEAASASWEPDSRNNLMRQIERYWALKMIDRHWIRHLYSLDSLRDGIGLQGYGQRDPLVEYTRESFFMFQNMRDSMRSDVLRNMFATFFNDPETITPPKQEESDYKPKSVIAPNPDQPTGVSDSPRAIQQQLGPEGGAAPQQRPSAQSYRQRAAETATQRADAQRQAAEARAAKEAEAKSNGSSNGNGTAPTAPPKQMPLLATPTPGRNDPCWCGSGKKYKACHYPEPAPVEA